jgi:hypothetical protein
MPVSKHKRTTSEPPAHPLPEQHEFHQRLHQTLTQQSEVWRERQLQEHWRIIYLDGVHFSIRHGDKADTTIILTAWGVDLAGNKEVLARCPCAEEDKEGWACEARKTCADEGRSRLICS